MTLMNDLGFNLYVVSQSLVMRLVMYFGVKESHQRRGPWEVKQGQSGQGQNQNQLMLIYRLRNYTVTIQYLQEVWNKRRVVYYAILLLLILGELLEEINYIIIIFPEYNIYSVFFSRHLTDSKLLLLIDLHFIIPKAVMMKISAQRFFPILPALWILY